MLARTPSVLDGLLRGLSAGWLRRNDGPGTWSALDIVGHLLHADQTNWQPRVRMILQHGTGRAFEPFDREAMLAWEPVPIEDLVDRFATSRRATLDGLALAELTDTDLDRTGLHPDLGEVRLGQMLASWVAHDLTHVAQVGEVLARQYRDEVGPWRQYMPALDRVAAAE